jgi:hypothetical protein
MLKVGVCCDIASGEAVQALPLTCSGKGSYEVKSDQSSVLPTRHIVGRWCGRCRIYPCKCTKITSPQYAGVAPNGDRRDWVFQPG